MGARPYATDIRRVLRTGALLAGGCFMQATALLPRFSYRGAAGS